MKLESLAGSHTPRRAFLLMPFALTGLAALVFRKERSLPAATQQGTGPLVTLADLEPGSPKPHRICVHKLQRSNAEWKDELSSQEFAVTRQKATELAYTGRYWNAHERGVYRCVCCGTALFSSQTKFDSGTGWPSFSSPIAAENIYRLSDTTFGADRSEVLCRKCDAHLGHVFQDGPPPDGLRYCINSAALRLVAA